MTKRCLLSLLVAFCFSTQTEAAVVYGINQFTNDGLSFSIQVATDDKDNFLGAFQDNINVFGTYSANGTAWTPPLQLSNNPTQITGGPAVAMDETSTGITFWTENNGGTYFAKTTFFNNGIWTSILPPLETTTDTLNSPSISMNGTGKALAGWANSSATEIHASFFNAGVWTPFQNIGVGNTGTNVVYNLNGQAAAGWNHFDFLIFDLWVTTYNGTIWQPPTLLDNLANGSPSLGIDANGNVIALWSGAGAQDIRFSRFNGASWSTPQTLSTAGGNGGPALAVFQDGTAIALWPDSAGVIQITQFNGVTWSPLTPFAPGVGVSITLDSKEDALINWFTSTNQIFAAILPKGGTLLPPVFVTTATTAPILFVDPALSSLSTLASLVWVESQVEGDSNSFGIFIAFGPTPPTNLQGATCHTALERVNVIAWTPSTDPTVVSYNVFRDGVLVAIVPFTGPFVFYDHNRCSNVPATYSVTAVNAEGFESTPVTITIN